MKKYPSKIGFGLVCFILAVVVGSTIPLISPPIWIGLIVNVLLLVFIAHLFKTTYYVIDGNSLIIKSSFLVNKKIDINRIRKISETNNPLSAPAASLDRLEIAYDRHGSILISPKDKSGLINHITRLNPQIEVQYKYRK
ncbi:PH domain-containing protein [Pricia antarctica]|uniref:PH domain-containing protein n=1 Tax=Pricia antarctica TaxID=641691 RepID=A0A1G7G9B6_9FLAO|nr:PH domain-containing protein [Pricia antarctica]SDE84738.1 PH domain-containing protein [Pricia antarctica]